MIISLKNILKIAESKNNAVGAFNTPNLESLDAVISAAEELSQPVIIMHAQIHEEIGICKIEDIAPIMLTRAEKASVPVCVHLDHGKDFRYVKKALEFGFNSVMYDGSMKPLEENIADTAFVVEMAAKYSACVEGEVGSMGKHEGCGEYEGFENDAETIYTEPSVAEKYVKETGIHALSCAFGTSHGLYTKEPKLDFERVSKINSLIGIPMVMHGGSGVSEDDFKEVIKRGIRKINYYTYLAKAGGERISQKDYSQFHSAVKDATEAMKQDTEKAIKVFANMQKGK